MKKKYRGLVIAAGALALLAVAYVLVVTLLPEPADEDDDKTLPTYSLMDYDTDDINTIRFDRSDGNSYTIVLNHIQTNSGGTSTNYLIQDKTQYEYNKDAFGTSLMYLGSISSDTLTEAQPKDLTIYGLDRPQVRMTVTPSDGEPTTLLLGNKAPVGTSYYGMVDGKPEVYLISDYIAKYMLMTDRDYRVLSMTSYSDVASELGEISIARGGETLLDIYRRTDEEMDADYLSTRYMLRAPIERNGNDTTIPDSVLTPVSELAATAVVEDAPKDLSKYGLDQNTTVINLSNLDGTSKKITVGKEIDGVMYGVVQGTDSVYSFAPSSFSFLDVDYKTLISKILWLHNITDIRRVDMDLNGETHVLELFDPTDDEVDEGKEFSGTLDGEKVSENNGRRLYTKVLAPTIYDAYEESPSAKIGAVEYTLKITADDGTVYKMEFAPINDRQYLAIQDGKSTGYYVNVNDLTAIKTAVDRVKKGENLSMAD